MVWSFFPSYFLPVGRFPFCFSVISLHLSFLLFFLFFIHLEFFPSWFLWSYYSCSIFCIVLLAAEASKRGQEKLKTEIQINVKKSEQHKNGFLLIEFLILNSTCSLRFNCYVHFTSRDLEQRGVNSYFKCCCM